MKEEVKLVADKPHGHAVLLCPECSSNKMRREGVVIYNRPQGKRRAFRLSCMSLCDVKIKLVEDPPGEGPAMGMQFVCLSCQLKPVLSMEERAGQTLIQWSYD